MKRLHWILFSALACTPFVTVAPDAMPDPWSPVRFMVGSWKGTATGQSGEGTVVRQYEFSLNQRFIHEKNTTT
jgi:hypothetical protein